MKAERLAPVPTFHPIVITIETREEAEHLYAMLNLPNILISNAYRDAGTECRVSNMAVAHMFKTLSNVFRP